MMKKVRFIGFVSAGSIKILDEPKLTFVDIDDKNLIIFFIKSHKYLNDLNFERIKKVINGMILSDFW